MHVQPRRLLLYFIYIYSVPRMHSIVYRQLPQEPLPGLGPGCRSLKAVVYRHSTIMSGTDHQAQVLG